MTLAEPVWLSRRMIESIHHQQIRQHGGGYGVRDEGLIDSALTRPQNRWGYSPESDLATLAAAYGFGLTKNHGFVDGNKRVGFMAMYVFLGLNGLEIDAPEEEVVTLMTEVASGGRSEDELAEWLRGRVAPLP
jgi:death-on-curing protein